MSAPAAIEIEQEARALVRAHPEPRGTYDSESWRELGHTESWRRKIEVQAERLRRAAPRVARE